MIGIIIILLILIFLLVFYIMICKTLIEQEYRNTLFNDDDMISELIETNRCNHLCNLWPPILVTSSVTSLILLIIYSEKNRSGSDIVFEYLVLNLIIFMPMFFTITWFQAHWNRERDDLIEKELLKLKRI